MRMSCNGCRVLRKGCSEDCTLRPCLQWIKSPESQANATLFLAKFYGRAGLVNLINAGPTHLRPAVFRSLLYEACGRVINPVYGSVGLTCSGKWDQCQAAVEAVLRGAPPSMASSGEDASSQQPLKGYDIRHLSKNSAAPLHRIKTRTRFKRSDPHARKHADSMGAEFMSESEAKFTITGWDHGEDRQDFLEESPNRAPSHDSFSVETVEPALLNRDDPPVRGVKPEHKHIEIGLELTLGRNPVMRDYPSTLIEISDSDA